METAFLKPQRCNWADEVERELSLPATDEQSSIATTDTWLYYTTSSSLPIEDGRQVAARKKHTTGRTKSKSKSKSRQSENDNSSMKDENKTKSHSVRLGTVRDHTYRPSVRDVGTGKGPTRGRLIDMVAQRQQDFKMGAATHAWTSNFDEREREWRQRTVEEKDAPLSKPVKPKHRNVVHHQEKAGAVLVITRTRPSTAKSQKDARTQQIKSAQAKKLKKLPPLSPAPSRSSRADSSADWKSDKMSTTDIPLSNCTSALRFQIETPDSMKFTIARQDKMRTPPSRTPESYRDCSRHK